MNILPLIATFTILFSAGIYAFFHETKNLNQERYHLFGAADINRQIANRTQKTKYLNAEGEAITHQNSKTPSKTKTTPPPRSSQLIYPAQKLNIRKLAQINPSTKLHDTALALIHILYHKTPFYHPNLEHEVLDTLIPLIKDHPDVTTLEALLPYIPEEKSPLFYKLFKGTQNEGGYPSFLDYLQLGSKTEKPIHLRRASKPLILALLGPKIGQQLLDEEATKHAETNKSSTLTKAELEDFLLKKRLNPADMADLVDYANTKGGPSARRYKAKDQKIKRLRH